MAKLLCLSLCVLFVSGCASTQRVTQLPPMGPANGIPVKAWIVRDNIPDIIEPDDDGWRGSDQDAQDLVAQLIQNAAGNPSANQPAMIAPAARFNVSFESIQVSTSLLSRGMSIEDFLEDVIEANHLSNHINIYFAGRVDNLVTPGLEVGISSDPGDAPQNSVPFVLVNDGFELASAGNPSEVADGHALEHEMAHFLGRFLGAVGNGPDFRTYGADEHVDEGEDNLLDREFKHPDSGLPGPSTVDGQEQHQIQLRILGNQVFVP